MKSKRHVIQAVMGLGALLALLPGCQLAQGPCMSTPRMGLAAVTADRPCVIEQDLPREQAPTAVPVYTVLGIPVQLGVSREAESESSWRSSIGTSSPRGS